jgi:hypothetical protein
MFLNLSGRISRQALYRNEPLGSLEGFEFPAAARLYQGQD